MRLFDLFRKNDKAPAVTHNYVDVEQKLLEQCMDFIPAHFRSSVYFADAVSHISHNQYRNAVASLIKMADQPSFFFNNDYWLELKHLATRLGMDGEISTCDRKLHENKDNNIVLYKGIVIEEVAEGTYKHYLSDSLSNEKNEERRTRDGLKELMGNDGFHMKGLGREGTIYYINGKRVCEIRYQQVNDGRHMIIYNYSFEYLALPIRQHLGEAEKTTLTKYLTEWLKGQGYTAEFQ